MSQLINNTIDAFQLFMEDELSEVELTSLVNKNIIDIELFDSLFEAYRLEEMDLGKMAAKATVKTVNAGKKVVGYVKKHPISSVGTAIGAGFAAHAASKGYGDLAGASALAAAAHPTLLAAKHGLNVVKRKTVDGIKNASKGTIDNIKSKYEKIKTKANS